MTKKALGVDKEGFKKVMRKRDYGADFSGQLGLALMSNLVGQLSYFYTDKVGLAVGAVGVVMAIAKIVDALTDVWVGNFIDHSKGNNRKYYRWMFRMAVPAGVIVFLMFTVPIQAGQVAGLAYALITNLLLTAVIYTLASTPFSATMVVRTNSQEERSMMGVMRAVASYAAGMIMVIATVPITNLLGGTQSAWIKYGAIMGLVVALTILICYRNGIKAEFSSDTEAVRKDEPEEEPAPFREAFSMLLRNKYWIIVLLFNLITSVTNTISGMSSNYYCKWIFGDDNLVAIIGAVGLISTAVGFVISQPMIKKIGVKKTIYFGLLGAAVSAAIRCIAPANLVLFVIMSMVGSFVQIPLMCLYGVLLAMVVDYNKWKYDKSLVAISSGAIGFGNKVGGGLGSMILAAFLQIGAYDSTLEVATTSMRYAIYGFSNYLPIVINLIMFFIFTRFDLEEKLPAMREEVARRNGNKK